MDVSVIIATYNRAEILRETLASLAALAPRGLAHEVLVVDNNSSDHTRDVVESFADRAPVRYLREERQGKNFALNAAIEPARGELLVFTDDDVLVPPDWLDRYWEEYQAHPEIGFFGGNIVSQFPEDAPRWATFPGIRFGQLDHGAESRVLRHNEHVHGANLAIPARLFRGGLRYDTGIGPAVTTARKGSETSLLVELRRQGLDGWFVAGAEVRHRIDCHPQMLSRRYHFRRRFAEARGYVYVGRSPRGTRTLLGVPAGPLVAVIPAIGRYLFAWITFWDFPRRVAMESELAWALGRTYEFWVEARDPERARS